MTQEAVLSEMLLPVRQVEKPWGCDVLPRPFEAPDGKRIGEIWFEPPAQIPELLVKYIFTSDKLSVQVHPSDSQTMVKGLGRQGKEECWLVIDAQDDARLGIGFDRAVDTETLRAAALDGRIEDMLVWHKVRPGDFFYIPANTVHAIGAGVSVIEIQQNSDITYRLFDYGRPRELHLDEGLAVSLGEVYDLARWHKRLPETGTVALVDGPYFRLDRVNGVADQDLLARYPEGPLLVIPVEGLVMVKGQPVPAGACAKAAGLDEISWESDALWLVAKPLRA
ncbi:class I mannose-6-phosphate isomerase [Novosphingobium sp. SG707]|uniref:class I mannose-6-phosphate isomerase n=1 Tax=Novosphingobium sp. SG707 TaxID=2586996 RepID=UPI001FF0DD3C|nr:class I mannose-6-phosphate isomerase [Novosphingobium sp. SG707]